MNRITAKCRSYLDDYQREEWPKSFVALPRVGDRVQSKSGKILAVATITHLCLPTEDVRQPNGCGPTVDILVELVKVF